MNFALNTAIRLGHLAEVQRLLTPEDATLTARYAVFYGHLDILKYVVETMSIDPRFIGRDGYSLLDFAMTKICFPSLTDYLLSRCTQLDALQLETVCVSVSASSRKRL